MQLLYESSAESPGVAGLKVLPGKVELLSSSVKRPQMQWNRLAAENHPLFDGLDGAWVYFVHSYAAQQNESTIATVQYGGTVAAAAAKDNVYAAQFHPEKSSKAGLRFLSNFMNLC